MRPGSVVEYEFRPVELRASDIAGLIADLVTPDEVEEMIRDRERDDGWHE